MTGSFSRDLCDARHDLSQNVNMRPERIVVPCALSLLFISQRPKCFDTFASVWFAETARNHSALEVFPELNKKLLFFFGPRIVRLFEFHCVTQFDTLYRLR